MSRRIGPATWVVPTAEVEAYRAAMGQRPGNVVGGGGLMASRNWVLDQLRPGDWCLQVSDDLQRVAEAQEDGTAAERTWGWAVQELLAVAARERVRLVGVAPTANVFYGRRRVHRAGFCVGDCLLIGETPLRFAPQLSLKEDYDFTLQHLSRYGAVARADWVLLTFAHHSPGGVTPVRSAEAEEAAIDWLLQRWPDQLRRNPRRSGEVLLRWRGAGRARGGTGGEAARAMTSGSGQDEG